MIYSFQQPSQDDVLHARVVDDENDLAGFVEEEPHYILTCNNCGGVIEVEPSPGGDGYETQQAFKGGWRNVETPQGWQVRCPTCLQALQDAKDLAPHQAGSA